jgi:hypothetical protein
MPEIVGIAAGKIRRIATHALFGSNSYSKEI